MRLVGTTSIDGHLLQTVAAIRHYSDLREEIEAAIPALSIATPQAQRLTMTAWIAQARVYAEDAPTSRLAPVGIHSITEVLKRLAREWWPGSVLALRRGARPARALGGIKELTSWTAVLERSRELTRSATSWADDLALEPSAHDAAERLTAALAVLERLGGPLSAAPKITSECPAIRLAKAELPRLRRVAADLRWLRGTVDPRSWGAAVGRVRGLARHLNDAKLNRLLDPSFSPENGWAELLGEDPEEHRLMATRPASTDSDEVLGAWLRAALGSSLALKRIRAIAAPIRSRVRSLELELNSRRLRRRLRKLLAVDRSTVERAAPLPAPDPEGLQSTIPHVPEVRTLIHGMHAAFLTNRKSPMVRAALRDLVGLRCDIIVNKVRRRQALCKRIASGRYDLVMVAHGFLSHGDTAKIRDACSDAGIPYIAVDKGRPATLIRLLFESRRNLRNG